MNRIPESPSVSVPSSLWTCTRWWATQFHSQQGMQIAKILPNREICFAGHNLMFKIPENPTRAEELREAINTFILMLSHLRGKPSGYFQTI